MANITYEPFRPESKSCRVYVNEQPDLVTAYSEWIYTNHAIDEFKLTKSVPKQYQKHSPRSWFMNGWIREKLEEQLTLF